MDWQRIREIAEGILDRAIKEYPRVKKWVIKGFPHAVIVAAGMIIVFFCIDRVNKHMGFMTNEFHKWLSMLLALSGIGYSIRYIAEQRRRERAAERRRIEQLKAQRAARAGQRSGSAPRTAPRPAGSGTPARLPAGRSAQQNAPYRR